MIGKLNIVNASPNLTVFSTGFTLDKESNTIAIICQDVTVVLAFDTRERLIQWQVKINNNLGDDCLHLQLYRNSKDRFKQGQTKASLSLQHFLGVESGKFHFHNSINDSPADKERAKKSSSSKEEITLEGINNTLRRVMGKLNILDNKLEEALEANKILKKEAAERDKKIEVLNKKIDALEQRSRINNVEIGNFPVTQNENQVKIVKAIGALVGAELKDEDIQAAHRVPRYNNTTKNIVIQFCSRWKRNILLQACAKYRKDNGKIKAKDVNTSLPNQDIYISEHLTPKNKMLLKKTKERAKANNWKYVWSKDGTIYARKNDSDKNRIQIRFLIPVLESPRKVLNTNGDFRLSDMNGGEESIWPSTETRPPTSDYGDTTSVTDYGGHGHGECGMWVGESSLERCVSCISKLGAGNLGMSRSSTAAGTPATPSPFTPAWTMENTLQSLSLPPASLNGGSGDLHTGMSTQSAPSVTSSSHSSGCTEYSVPRFTPPLVSSRSTSTKPKRRYLLLSTEKETNQNVSDSQSRSSCVSPNQFGNYDVPPAPVAIGNPKLVDCCEDPSRKSMACPCSHVTSGWLDGSWMRLPYCSKRPEPVNASIQRVKLSGEGKMPVSINGELAIYATVDKSKKTKNQTPAPPVPKPEEPSPSREETCGNYANIDPVEPSATQSSDTNTNNSWSKKTKNQTPAPPVPKPEESSPSREETCGNYANIDPVEPSATQPSDTNTNNSQENYMNLSFAQSLDLYENARDVLHKAGITSDDTELIERHNAPGECHAVLTCGRCGHSSNPQDDYLMMEPGKLPCSEPVHKHFPGYLPMSPSPASTSDLIKLRHSHCMAEKAASNPSLSSPFDRCRKRSEPTTPRVSGTAMLGSYNEGHNPYTRHRTGSMSCLRRRSNSADATRYLDDLESITERTVSSGTSTQINQSESNTRYLDDLESITERTVSSGTSTQINQSESNTTSVESITSQTASPKHTVVETVASNENDKSKDEGDMRLDNSLRTLVRECMDHYDSSVHVRRSSSVPCKSVNRDSSSSNDSGVSTGSLKQRGTDFAEFELPLTTAMSSRRHHLAFHHGLNNSHCLHASLPRKSKSSDPLQELTFTFQKVKTPIKSSSAEAEVPVFPNKKEGVRGCNGTIVDCRSMSSGTSDMSDYIETLSMSSHSSSDTNELRLIRSTIPTLKPRSGQEYQQIDRNLLDQDNMKMNQSQFIRGVNLPPYTPVSDSSSPGYSSEQ
ncbi:LOW QUALITY PROTEIN: uncharacterized protein LOC103513744 [Diaphorina citri]|uniref:LOW QUALITY PROTEIN: uncharacterized protein LOC103513744 n=1 Tax=Diaphorina citri TaxID=121845 RepID=A0A3Q0J207_DIACI|nr:LOW QUALITY PROTEIN: uncharacterized protein LOC103513744 [Diaphorina citri]